MTVLMTSCFCLRPAGSPRVRGVGFGVVGVGLARVRVEVMFIGRLA